MLELQGGKLLLASPDMEIVIKGGTKMEKWSTAAIQTTFFSVMTRFSNVGPIAHPANDAKSVQSSQGHLTMVIKPSLLT
jgi:hypothetical protein